MTTRSLAHTCYVTGTMIRTTRGDVPVELLRIGERVLTASGAYRKIKWIGRRHYAGRFVANNPAILPICFKADAIADGVPERDLWVSPNHAMFLEGVLIEARHLINGVSVVQASHIDEVAYWHIEFNTHDVVIAEGAASESYVDAGNRSMFHNAADYHARYPGEGPTALHYRAPRVDHGAAFDAARFWLAMRAANLIVAVLQRYRQYR